MRYYIIAGEASGDLHGSRLIAALKKLDPEASIRCWGGDLMQSQGAVLVKHYRDLAFMGFVEVLRNLPAILRNLKYCKEDIREFKPDVLVLIDYPGFNLRIAKWARAEGLRIVYYISPQVWAWKEKRVEQIKLNVDKMLVILPFEKDYYHKKGFEVEYTGHPLAEVIAAKKNEGPEIRIGPEPVIALLPGSRKQEISIKLPIMLEASRSFGNFRFVVAMAPGIEEAFYSEMLKGYTHVTALKGHTYDLLLQSKAALVTSGTATLETALFGVPQIVCYKGSAISYQIAKRLIKVKYISLVNLIMNREVVKELIQDELTVNNIKAELTDLLYNPKRIESVKKDYAALQEMLESGGKASENAARAVFGMT